MTLLDSKDHLCGIEPGEVLLKDVVFDKQVKEISSTHVIQNLKELPTSVYYSCDSDSRTHQVQVVLVLKAVMEFDDPIRAIWGRNKRRRFEDLSLSSDMTFLPLPQHVNFSKLLQLALSDWNPQVPSYEPASWHTVFPTSSPSQD